MNYLFVRLEKGEIFFHIEMKEDLYPEYIRNLYDLLEK